MLHVQQHIVGFGSHLCIEPVYWSPVFTAISQADRGDEDMKGGRLLAQEMKFSAVA